jgi:hypothetical protein
MHIACNENRGKVAMAMTRKPSNSGRKLVGQEYTVKTNLKFENTAETYVSRASRKEWDHQNIN